MENLFQSLTQAAPIIAIFGAAYFILFRPQQQKMKAHQDLLSRLAIGDRVVTSGGLMGSVHKLDGDFVHVTIASGVTVKVRKSHIVEVVSSTALSHTEAHSEKKEELVGEPQSSTPSGKTPKQKAPDKAKKEGSSKSAERSSGKKAPHKSKKEQI